MFNSFEILGNAKIVLDKDYNIISEEYDKIFINTPEQMNALCNFLVNIHLSEENFSKGVANE